MSMKRIYRRDSLRRWNRPRARQDSAERELRRTEIELLHQQVRIGRWNAVGVAALTLALVLLTFFQWRTADDLARIDRAKAQPHFRIRQENQHDELGFLPRRFAVEAEAGVSDATEASAASMMVIYFVSRDLGMAGSCRASFANFYGWTNDAVSFEINDAADRLMTLSRAPDTTSLSYIRLRPLWVVVGVSFIDIFDTPGRQELLLTRGMPRRLASSESGERSQAGMSLHLAVDERGTIVVYPLREIAISAECRDALRVMSQIPWLRVARPDELPSDTDIPF